jgi:hypothetical protein
METNAQVILTIASTKKFLTFDSTAFFLANEYIRAMGLPGLADAGDVGKAYKPAVAMAERQMGVAAGTLDLDGLAEGMKKGNC